MSRVQIYTDDSTRGNPGGLGGYGVVLHSTDSKGQLHEGTMSDGHVRTTNNRMELMATIVGLEALDRPCEVRLYSDSKYLTDAFSRGWADGWIAERWSRGKSGPAKNIDLWKRLLEAEEPHRVEFVWVKGRASHPQNERCDQLVTSVANGSGPMIDEGLES